MGEEDVGVLGGVAQVEDQVVLPECLAEAASGGLRQRHRCDDDRDPLGHVDRRLTEAGARDDIALDHRRGEAQRSELLPAADDGDCLTAYDRLEEVDRLGGQGIEVELFGGHEAPSSGAALGCMATKSAHCRAPSCDRRDLKSSSRSSSRCWNSTTSAGVSIAAIRLIDRSG